MWRQARLEVAVRGAVRDDAKRGRAKALFAKGNLWFLRVQHETQFALFQAERANGMT